MQYTESNYLDELKPPVCYRFVPHGEPIHSYLDLRTRTIEGFPEYVFDPFNLVLPEEYVYKEYNDYKYPIENFAEAALLMDGNNCIAIDTNNYGYRVMDFNGTWFWVNRPDGEKEGFIYTEPPCTILFKFIGYRPSKVRQYRGFSSIFRLQYCPEENLVYTDEGLFELGMPYESIGAPSPTYAGYKDIVANSHFAVVYVDGNPVFLRRDGDRIIPI